MPLHRGERIGRARARRARGLSVGMKWHFRKPIGDWTKLKCPFPIAIMSFNRPELLRLTLESLARQSVTIDDRQVHLFQDGPLHATTEPDRPYRRCIEVFKRSFPGGHVHELRDNIGVALNFDRAERTAFDDLKADCGLFFEDDLVLQPNYLFALIKLAEFALNEPLVGYAAAYGRHLASQAEQRARASEIVPLGYNWGFPDPQAVGTPAGAGGTVSRPRQGAELPRSPA